MSPLPKFLALLALLGCLVLGGLGVFGRAPQGASSHQESAEAGEEEDEDFTGWRRLALLSGNGKIKPNGLNLAAARRKAMSKGRPRVLGDLWSERGPRNIAGRAKCLVIHPGRPDTMWMGSDGGGIWRTDDGGQNWRPVSDDMLSLQISCLVMDPLEPRRMYAGTGRAHGFSQVEPGTGLYKSEDGGESWQQVAGTIGIGAILNVAISPHNPKVLLLSAASPGGIFRSINYGDTWQQVASATRGWAVGFLPDDPNGAVASISNEDPPGHYAQYVLVSENGGETWHRGRGVPDINQDVVIPLQPAATGLGVVYASVANGKVYRSDDGGNTYAVCTTGARASTVGPQNNTLWVDPTNPKNLLVGGTTLYRSLDSGTSFTRITEDGLIATERPHVDFHAIVHAPGFDGQSNRKVYIATDGGIYRTDNFVTASTAAGWARLDRTARTTEYYGVAANGESGLVVGGAQDNGSHALLDGSDLGTLMLSGDGGFCAIDPENPDFAYFEASNLTIRRNTTGGRTPTAFSIWTGIGDADSSRTNFIAPFVLDPLVPQSMLAGGRSLWRSPNVREGIPTWTAIKPPVPILGAQPVPPPISAIAIAPTNRDLIYVGYNDGRLYKTTTGSSDSPEWLPVDDNQDLNPLPNKYITRILIDPDDSERVYLATGGFDRDNLLVTANGGESWFSASGSGEGQLPDVPIRAIARKPTNPNVLYVGTEVGIFSSSDQGASWSTTNDAAANVSVYELSYAAGSTRLFAATYGRGIWQMTRGTMMEQITFDRSSVRGGSRVTATIDLADRDTAGPLSVQLSCPDPSVKLPQDVTIPKGKFSASFEFETVPVDSSKTVLITASMGNSRVVGELRILTSKITGFEVRPDTVAAGSSATGRITLGTPAPDGGAEVHLSTDSASVMVPESVKLQSGGRTAEFGVTTGNVTEATVVRLTARYGGNTRTTDFKVVPVRIASIAVAPKTVVADSDADPKFTVTLTEPPPTDAKVALTSLLPAVAELPQSVTVIAGATAGQVTVHTHAVTVATVATLVAKDAFGSKQTTLKVTPPGLSKVSLSQSSVVGGSGTAVWVVVALNGSAPRGGVSVRLDSASPSVNVPTSVMIAEGARATTVELGHQQVSMQANAEIHGWTDPAVVKSATLLLKPFEVKSLAVSPVEVTGGVTGKGIVRLNATAPLNGMSVDLGSDSQAASVPKTVTFPPGTSSQSFAISTVAVPGPTPVELTATLGSSSRAATLTLLPAELLKIAFSPNKVVGGSAAVVTGAITLTGPSSGNGYRVILSSSDWGAASPPQAVIVPPGESSVTFSLGHFKVAKTVTVTITARGGQVVKTATVKVIH